MERMQWNTYLSRFSPDGQVTGQERFYSEAIVGNFRFWNGNSIYREIETISRKIIFVGYPVETLLFHSFFLV